MNDDLLGVLGSKVYQLTTTYDLLGVSGVQPTGEYAAGTDISDDLVNLMMRYRRLLITSSQGLKIQGERIRPSSVMEAAHTVLRFT